jgi:hypothetical protein
MGFSLALSLLVLGFLLATEYVVALVPQTEPLVDKLAPFRGWIGLGLALTGVWWTLNYLLLSNLNLIDMFRSFKLLDIPGGWKILVRLWLLYFTAVLPSSLLMLFGGFLLGFDKIAELTGKGDQLETIKVKIAPYQRKIGVASLFIAVWLLLLNIAWGM